jgi:hypothetical protein
VRPELAAELRAHLEGRALPVTGADSPTVSGLQLDRQTRVAVRAQGEVLLAVLADLPRRRADIEEWAGSVLACRSAVEDLGERLSGVEELVVRPPPGPGWTTAPIAVGVSIALHLCEAAAIGYLLVRP